MEFAVKLLLFLHVMAGFTSLTIGLVPFLTKKGGKVHRMSGKIFYNAMLITAVSALLLSLYRFNPFLFMVGMLTGYSTFTGLQGLKWMRKQKNKAERQDWMGLWIFSGLLVGFLVVALVWLYPQNLAFVPVLIIFTLFLLSQILEDASIFTGKKVMKSRNNWILYHIGRITGAYIAALTAFLVNVVPTPLGILGWLLPAVIGVPLIFYFQKQYGTKKKWPTYKNPASEMIGE